MFHQSQSMILCLVCAGALSALVTKKKTKGGKLFYVVDVIDNNSVQTRIRCWSVNPERDILYVNRPYMIKPQYNDTWGFSTRGSLNRTWVMYLVRLYYNVEVNKIQRRLKLIKIKSINVIYFDPPKMRCR